MVQGRFEPSAAEQLLELRRSRDRYAALAERLHDSADPDLDPEETRARESDARRIAHAYEKSISNSVVRMSSMGQTHRLSAPALGMRTWVTIFMAISLLEGGVLLAHFRPQLFRLPPGRAAKVERLADRIPDRIPAHALPAPPKPIAPPQSAPAPVAPPVIAAAPATPAPPPQAPARTPAATPAPTPPTPAPAARATPTPATPTPTAPTPKASAPAPSIPTPSARPTSGPVLASPAPSAPVTPPPPPVAAATPAPSAPVISITETPLAPIAPPPVAAAPSPSPVAPSQAQAAAPVLTRPEAIAATHTLPPYPAESKRMGESGKTLMKVTISPQGTASECMVVTTSGSGRLDAAACNHVETRWRWKPATRDGAPVATTTAVTVVWSLQSGR